MISITLLERDLLKKVRRHIKKHEGKYLTGAGLTVAGLGLATRGYGKNIQNTRIKNIGNVAAVGGASAALRSGVYSLVKDQIKDLRKKSKKKYSQEIK